MFFKLAWRNIWRNQTRTLITMSIVFLAVILSTLMMSVKEGMYTKMIESMIGSYMGFGQVHAKDYWEEKSLDYSFELNEELASKVNGTKGIKSHLPRVESFALAASDSITKAGMVVGVDTEKEAEINELNDRVSEGEYLKPDDKAVLVGTGLAERLKIGVGDTLILLGQGYHAVSAEGKYPVKGLIKFGNPEISKQIVFLPLKEAQWFYGMEGMANNLILQFDDPDAAEEVLPQLEESLGEEYEVMGWTELMPQLKNMIETDRVEGYVFMFILYFVISFGILGTSLMMLAERKHEFGVLVAVGMKRIRLAVVVWLEMVMISLAGAFVGMLLAFPVCYYFYANPVQLGEELTQMTEEYGMEAVIQGSIEASIFIQQGTIIFLIATAISLYSFVKLMRMNAIKAMRS